MSLESATSIIKRIHASAEACPEHRWVPLLASALATRGEVSPGDLGARFPLLLVLYLLAHPRTGLVLVEKEGLVGCLGADMSTIDGWLGDLEARKFLILREPGPYLVITIASWPGARSGLSVSVGSKTAKVSEPEPPSTPPPGIPGFRSALNESDSGNSGTEQNGAESERIEGAGVRGPGSEGEGAKGDWLDGFLDRLVAVTQDPDERASYRSFCGKHPRPVLEAALARVAETPTARLRKRPGAFFIHLVKSHSKQNPI